MPERLSKLRYEEAKAATILWLVLSGEGGHPHEMQDALTKA